jgi:hypothetical protein
MPGQGEEPLCGWVFGNGGMFSENMIKCLFWWLWGFSQRSQGLWDGRQGHETFLLCFEGGNLMSGVMKAGNFAISLLFGLRAGVRKGAGGTVLWKGLRCC